MLQFYVNFLYFSPGVVVTPLQRRGGMSDEAYEKVTHNLLAMLHFIARLPIGFIGQHFSVLSYRQILMSSVAYGCHKRVEC